MTAAESSALGTKRILVSMDTSACGQAALDVAVRLAINCRAELHGLFVEDEDLVRLASLPFAREIEFSSASTRKLQSANMERELQASAQQAQRAFAAATQQFNLQWTFQIVRGTVTQASLAAADDVDLLVIGNQGHRSLNMTVDYLPQRAATRNRIVAVFDGSPSAFRAIELASNLAESRSDGLTILVLADNGAERSRQCLLWLQQHGIRAEINQAIRPSNEAVIDYVQKYSPDVVLINRDSDAVGESQIYRIINEFDCPLILC